MVARNRIARCGALRPQRGTNLCAVPGRQSGIVGTAAELDDSRFNRLVEQDLVRGANQMGVAIDRTQRNLSDTCDVRRTGTCRR